MEKKTKNIIGISIAIILIIGIVLTIHFAKNSGKKNFDNDRNIPTMKDGRKTDENIKERSFPKENEVGSSKTEEKTEESTVKDNEINDKEKGRDSNSYKRPSFDQFEAFDKDFDSNRNGMTTTYVIILGIETFLLGGTTMFLIMNNINNEDKQVEVITKEKKAKK